MSALWRLGSFSVTVSLLQLSFIISLDNAALTLRPAVFEEQRSSRQPLRTA